MSTRPPTLREKRRYILARVEPAGLPVDTKDLYYALYEAVTSLWGDVVTAAMRPAVISAENGFVILRCRRGTEREFAIALSTVTTCHDCPIAIRVYAISGTIESLRERIKTLEVPALSGPSTPGRELFFNEKAVEIASGNGQKVDVIEKGFKNAHRLFLTREDLEEP
jgi:ribonuclease P/MRP protein subunit POP5